MFSGVAALFNVVLVAIALRIVVLIVGMFVVVVVVVVVVNVIVFCLSSFDAGSCDLLSESAR